MSSAIDREITDWFDSDGLLLMKLLGVESGQRVLDFGCGIGGYAIPLADAVAPDGRVFAVDKNSDNLGELRKRLSGHDHTKCVSIRHTDGGINLHWLKAGSLDAVLVFDVLHIITDWQTLFGEMRRVIRRGGALYVNPASLSHPGEVNVRALMEVLPSCGFALDYSVLARAWHYHKPSTEEIFVFCAV